MKSIIFFGFLFIASYSYADYLAVNDGNPIIVKDAERNLMDIDFPTVNVSSVTIAMEELKLEGFNKPTKTDWVNEINKRLVEKYEAKKLREYPSVSEQLEAIWKIILRIEDDKSNATRDKVLAILTKYSALEQAVQP